jgi:hypothetical protein
MYTRSHAHLFECIAAAVIDSMPRRGLRHEVHKGVSTLAKEAHDAEAAGAQHHLLCRQQVGQPVPAAGHDGVQTPSHVGAQAQPAHGRCRRTAGRNSVLAVMDLEAQLLQIASCTQQFKWWWLLLEAGAGPEKASQMEWTKAMYAFSVVVRAVSRTSLLLLCALGRSSHPPSSRLSSIKVHLMCCSMQHTVIMVEFSCGAPATVALRLMTSFSS